MSALAPARPRPAVTVPVGGPARAAAAPERPLVRLAAFVALAGWGVSRWATLMRPAPGWRLVGLLALITALAGGVRWLSGRHRGLGWLAVAVLILLAFPVAGLPWSFVVHLRIARSVREIGDGLAALPNVLVPYLGASRPVRLDILLGAAVLGLDAAAVLAFAGRPGTPIGDGRRAAAALPLVALAVVPSTLVHPVRPYLQGLLLFALLAALVWGERVRLPAVGAAVGVLLLGGLAAIVLAPRLDQHRAWVDYRAWAGAAPRAHLARFDWDQTYGPLRWPHTGHVVMTVTARRADYWKAEDLDEFDGTGWRYGISAPIGALPTLAPGALARFTQTIDVSISGMQTPDVIAAGSASPPRGDLPGGYAASLDAGSWTADRPLGAGTSYQITTYSPSPTNAELGRAGRAYPAGALAGDLTLQIPLATARDRATTTVSFPVFHSGGAPSIPAPAPAPDSSGPLDGSAQAYVPASPPPRVGRAALRVLDASPYARVYALARHLARAARTPQAYVQAVMRYLAHGFVYDQNPPVTRFPLATFLLSDRRGYCQQFSGAMALLLRMGGIPARVASGFTPGTRSGNRFVVTDLDAHAWVEVWFPGFGWVRRDPTPSADPALRSFVSHANLPPTPSLPQGSSRALPRTQARAPSGATATTHPVHRRGSGFDPWPVVGLVALGLAFVLLGLAAARSLRGDGAAGDPVAELERAMRRTGRPLPGGSTLSSIERRVAGSPAAAEYVRALRTARYRGGGPPPSARGRRALRRELARGGGPTGRLRALWALPPRPGARRATHPSDAARRPPRPA